MESVSPDSLLPPLVVRNKRGRKVDETLPKSHQREVQRQFRARRAGHLLDLERRVSVLERENLILRHWAGVHPANRYLLGRGPTGCDTTKPLISDENDPEIQLVIDENSPRDRSWPPPSAIPPARPPPFSGEQSDAVGPNATSSQSAQPASATSTTQSMMNGSPMNATTSLPVFENKQQQGGGGFDSYPDARKFKPHPLYDQRPLFGDYPTHVSNFEQNVPPMAAERLLVKRESIYAPPPGQPALSSLLSHQQQRTTDIPPHDYYHSQQRPSFSRPGEGYSSQPISGVHADISSNGNPAGPTTTTTYHTMYPAHLVPWPDSYSAHNSSTSASQIMNRRPQPATALTPLTPVIPPVGLTSNSGSNGSPSSQPTSASGSVPDQQQRLPAIPADSIYAPRRPAAYVSGFPSTSSTPTPPSYMPSSTQPQSSMYSHHGESAEQAQSQQQQQQRQRQYHDGSDTYRQ